MLSLVLSLKGAGDSLVSWGRNVSFSHLLISDRQGALCSRKDDSPGERSALAWKLLQEIRSQDWDTLKRDSGTLGKERKEESPGGTKYELI